MQIKTLKRFYLLLSFRTRPIRLSRKEGRKCGNMRRTTERHSSDNAAYCYAVW